MGPDTRFRHFRLAQEGVYEQALREIKNGRKLSHWMWFIFPQLSGLGSSSMAQKYAIASVKEAAEYLEDAVLSRRLISISTALMAHENKTAYQIFGTPDDMKLRSSMTLFSLVPGADPVFKSVLRQFYKGQPDEKTLQLLELGSD